MVSVLLIFLSLKIYGKEIVHPKKLEPNAALYELFSIHFVEEWKAKGLGKVGTNDFFELLDPIPIFDLSVSCHSMRVIAIPFEDIKARGRLGKLTSSLTWINKAGSRVLVYGVDFKNRNFKLLFDGVLVNLYGAEDIKSDCPDLIGLVASKTIRIQFSNKLQAYQLK